MKMSTESAYLREKEQIPVEVYPRARDASGAVAGEIARLIRDKAAAGKQAVLGLATGSTPTGVYDELIRLHREEGLSFANVVTFNLDEYFPMQPEELQSYHRFMHEHLFDHIDIPPENVHIPDGTLPMEQVGDHCRGYEEQIAKAGGIDLQLLGIGRTGHIGFNEPGSGKTSRTRLITLDKVTRLDAASDFFGEEHVPRRAITMGVGTILAAHRVVIMAWGEHKARIARDAIEGEITSAVAASFLQEHPNAAFVLDEAAAAELTRSKCPWLVGHVEWTKPKIRHAVIWLAQLLGKPILKLTEEDYNEAGLQDLLAEHG
ncbi:MAG: glucosamine-6-phosphate deaminase, partial [Pirellulales bacterium]